MKRMRQLRAWAALLLAAAVPTGASHAQVQAPQIAPTQYEAGVDPRIRPGDDFFAYANADWLRQTSLPAPRGRWSARDEINLLTRQRIAALMGDEAFLAADVDGRKLADLQTAWRDETTINARGLRPVLPLLRSIAAVDSKRVLAQYLGRTMRADVDPLNWGVYTSRRLFGLAVQHGIHGQGRHFAYLLQGGLGLPSREQYLREDEASQRLRLVYRDHIAQQLAQAGFVGAQRRADAVLALEAAIARSHFTEQASSDDHNADNHWTRADFKARAPGLDWDLFFAAAGLARQPDIVVWQPGAIVGTAALLAAQPLPVWKDYLRFHALAQLAPCLPAVFAEAAQRFAQTQLAAEPAPSRAQQAQTLAAQALPQTLARLYVQRHFPPAAKAQVQGIATNVMAAFAKRVQVAAWMSPTTRALALAKLQTVYFGLGAPEQWTDTSGLRIDPADACGNSTRVEAWNYRRALRRLQQPLDKREWVIPAHTVGAVYLPLLNAYNFAAALLQPPKFDPDASGAANYGAIGAIIGHELSHFVDTLGADYDGSGALRNWWTAEDRDGLAAAVLPLVQQFAAYSPLPGLAIDGQRTLNENLADLAGLAAAFDAHRAALRAHHADQAFMRQQDRQFFIAFARSWRSVSTDDALRSQLGSDAHAPDRWRVATVRNLDAWYEAFDVLPGQALYLPPQARLRIW
jgi:putative endopeptidase